MQHHFDVELAQKYGVAEAILLNHFEYWIELNRTNEKNFYDGRYWTFNSMKAFSKIFPYMTEKKIRNALKHLQDEGLIVTGNYNKLAYDRTLWYAFSDLAESILPKGQMENPERANGYFQKGEPIPDNKPDNDTDRVALKRFTPLEAGQLPDKCPDNVRQELRVKSLELRDNSLDKKKEQDKKRKRFTPPTVEEVAAYCGERNNRIDPQTFVDFYASKGWVVGKSKMKDWKAAIRTWEKRDGNSQPERKVNFLP